MKTEIKIQHNPEDLDKINVIYQIECVVTGDKYVGQTRKMIQRLRNHLGCHSSSYKSGNKGRTVLYDDAKLYGWENFRLSIIAENVTDKKLRIDYFEKNCQGTLEFFRYAENDLNRKTTPKRKKPFLKIHNVKTLETLFFKNPKSALDFVESYHNKKFHRTALVKAQSNNYLLNKTWEIIGISETEYQTNIGQLTINI